ncbi:hypothetical protein DITRI_Ditri16bG0126600 [Diplodiscus trichospermus]
MFEAQHFSDLQNNSSFGESKSWLSEDNNSPTQSSVTYSSNVDRLLYNDLVKMIPLVQSLIGTDVKGRNAAQSIPLRKKKDRADKNGSNNQDGDSHSIFSSRALAAEKENEELVALRKQLEDLQREILELIKSIQMQLSDAKIKLG